MKKILTKFVFLSFFLTPTYSYAKTYSKALLSNYDAVWKGVLISLAKYPLDKNDQESGEITTSIIKPGDVFTPYNKTSNPKEMYQLFIQVQKRSFKGRGLIQVKVEKKSFLKGDFFNQKKNLTSDGVEENIVLYRTAREVNIDKTVDKLFN